MSTSKDLIIYKQHVQAIGYQYVYDYFKTVSIIMARTNMELKDWNNFIVLLLSQYEWFSYLVASENDTF